MVAVVTAPSAFRVEQAMSIAQAVMARLEADGTINPETDEAALLAALTAEGADIETILRRMIQAAIEADAMHDAVTLRMEEMGRRRERHGRRHDAYRGAAFAIMDALGMQRFADAEFTATIGKPRAAVVITDEAAVPGSYFDTVRKLRRADLSADVKAGVVVPGAQLTNSMPTLTIRKG